MEQAYTIIGNSIVNYIDVEGVGKDCFPGKTLRQMREGLEMPGTKIVTAGIPDVMSYRGATHVDGELVSSFEKELDCASRMPGVILCPFYPPRSLVAHQWGIIQRLNQRICRLNAEKGEGTPALIQGLFGRSRGGRLFFREDRLADEAHPSCELANELSTVLRNYIRQRSRGREDLRITVDREGSKPDVDMDGERGDEADGATDGGVEKLREVRDELCRIEDEQRRDARQRRQEKEDEIRTRLKEQLARELERNERRYREELSEISRSREQAEDRLREREQELRRRERRREDRQQRELERPRKVRFK